MNSHQFFSANTNNCNATPVNINGQSVILSQEQQRKLLGCLNTCIMGSPSNNPSVMFYFSPGNFLQAKKRQVFGGVEFFFEPQRSIQPPSQMNYNFPTVQVPDQYQEPSFCPATLEQQIAMDGLRKHGLQCMEYQQQLSNNPFYPQYQYQPTNHPFQLKFHQNVGTSADSSNACYKSTSDFANAGGFSNMLTETQAANLRKMETRGKLVLSKPLDPPTGHVADVLDEMVEPIPKKVSFSVDNPEETTGPISTSGTCKDSNVDGESKKVDQSQQVSFPCVYTNGNNSRCETCPPKPKKTIWPNRKKKSSGSESCSSENQSRKNQQKQNKKKPKKEKKAESPSTDSESTEDSR
ncbi:hypothetical protein JTB14_037514 [Gonioctena quinquepunctata]|nr:hypothetical protein JTB14_037514 [Gonioctena quinquepunctata]